MTNRPGRLMGNGEGFTTLILTDEGSRMIRNALTKLQQEERWGDPLMHFNAGIQRATERIQSEFAEEQKARKVAAAGVAALRSLGVEPTAADFDNAIAKDIEAEQKGSGSLTRTERQDMSNRSDVFAILADIDDTISRVRDLSTSPERAAALQCLADARRHLARVERAKEVVAEFYRVAPSVQPSATDNQPARNKANEAFRESRRILRGVLK